MVAWHPHLHLRPDRRCKVPVRLCQDIPLADVSQDMQTKNFHLAAIGYQYNIEEINTAIQIGASLPNRRARAARLAYTKFMYDLTLQGNTEKGLGGLINYPGVVTAVVPGDGTGSAVLGG